jgi:hypothetical protein
LVYPCVPDQTICPSIQNHPSPSHKRYGWHHQSRRHCCWFSKNPSCRLHSFSSDFFYWYDMTCTSQVKIQEFVYNELRWCWSYFT